MKKLNTSNAFAMLALGFTLVVVAAGCGGNDTTESALTKNGTDSITWDNNPSLTIPGISTGKSETGSKGSTGKSVTGSKSSTKNATVGSADGGAGGSATPSKSDLENPAYVVTMTNSQMNALTSEQWDLIDMYLTEPQVASIPLKSIKLLSTTALDQLSKDATQALSTAQLNSMSKEQLTALAASGDLDNAQKETVYKKLEQLSK